MLIQQNHKCHLERERDNNWCNSHIVYIYRGLACRFLILLFSIINYLLFSIINFRFSIIYLFIFFFLIINFFLIVLNKEHTLHQPFMLLFFRNKVLWYRYISPHSITMKAVDENMWFFQHAPLFR